MAHDAIVGNECIIGNSTKLAGEIVIDDKAILSASVLMHQFCRVGSYCMVGGGTRFSQNILPFSLVARDPASVSQCYRAAQGPRSRQLLRSERGGTASSWLQP